MSCGYTRPAESRARGFTLLEALLAMAISLVILAGLTGFFYNIAKMNTTTLRMIHLRQELRAMMTTISDEIRRSGYRHLAGNINLSNSTNHFAAIKIIGNTCLLYSYDRHRDDRDGWPDADDQGGFRLTNGVIQRKTSDTHCDNSACRDCRSGRWWRMNDDHSLRITRLRFDSIHAPLISTAHPPMRGIIITLGGQLIRQPNIKLSLQDTVYLRNQEKTGIPP